MNINILEVLTEEEIKQIAKEQLAKHFSSVFRDEKQTERILTNTAYEIVHKMVDSTIDEELDSLLSKKVKKIVAGLSTFEVFKEPNAWDRQSNSMYKILERELLARKSEIGDVVVKSLQQAPKQYVRAIGQEAFTKIVADAMRLA